MRCKLLWPTSQYWFLDLTALKSSFWTVRVLSASTDLVVLWSRRICLIVFFFPFFVDTGIFYLGFAGRWPTTRSGSFRKTAGSVARKTSTDCKFSQHCFLSSSSVCLLVSLVYTSLWCQMGCRSLFLSRLDRLAFRCGITPAVICLRLVLNDHTTVAAGPCYVPSPFAHPLIRMANRGPRLDVTSNNRCGSTESIYL